MVRAPRTQEEAVADGFFLLRTPLLPASTLACFASETGIPAEARASELAFETWVTAERARERMALRLVVELPMVREALFVASPSLVDSLKLWESAPDSPEGHAVEAALFRYVQRMSARPTPFGLFAGITLGTTGDRTALALTATAQSRRYTRLDNDYLERLTDALADDPDLRVELRFEPNTSIYRVADRIHFIEGKRDEHGRRYVLSAVDAVPALSEVLAEARAGRPLAELAAAVSRQDPEIPVEDAIDFIDELVQTQLLVPALAPPVTGVEPMQGVIAELGTHPAAARLTAAKTRIEALDASGIGQPLSAYREIEETLRGCAGVDERPRFQVDLLKVGHEVLLGGEVLNELDRGVALLARLDAGEPEGIVAKFARAFTRRFEDEEVPLAVALDPEFGVGLGDGVHDDPTSVLATQSFDEPEPFAGTWSARDQRLLELLADARGSRNIELDDRACRGLERRPSTPLPRSFCAMAMVHAPSAEALDRGDFQLEFGGFGGPSGANLFGRFCHADPELKAWVLRHLRAEQAERPDAVFAEIVHWPEGRIGNVIVRPVLRDHEIVFLARGGAPPDGRILLDDLRVSVRGGRVRLRSERLGREIIPRLTSAHVTNSPRNPSAYRFLGELAGQGSTGGIHWSWGALGAAPFLPRVGSGRIVLSLARWHLTREQTAALIDPRTRTARLRALLHLRAELDLPRHVALVERDQLLPVDLDSVLSAEAFLHAARGKQSLTLVEQLVAQGGAARAPDGRFRAELQVAYRAAPSAHPAAVLAPVPTTTQRAFTVERVFPPGSSWLYLQLFAGPSTVDRALLRLAPLLASEQAVGRVDRWFFLRYSEPSWHLRLRVHGAPESLWSDVRGALQPVLAELVANHGVHRIVYETYRREIERYGGDVGIELAERFFHLDSTLTVSSLAALVGDEHADQRFRFALTSADLLLAALIPDIAARQSMIEQTRDALRRSDLRGGVDVTRWLGAYARRERALLESIGELDAPFDSPLAEPLDILRAHRPPLVALGNELNGLERTGRLGVSVQDLTQSLLHMHVNRLLRADHRRQEAVLYDLLWRVYRSRAARGRA